MSIFKRDFLLLLAGRFVTNLGNQVHDIAMLLWIKELTGSPAVMGIALMLTNLPEPLLAPLGGKVADRLGKVRTMVGSDLVSFLAVLAVFAVALGKCSPGLAIATLCASNVILGVAASCFIPASFAIVPDLVPRDRLEKGNAVHGFSGLGAKAAGQGIGGLLFSAFGAAPAFLINALSFLASALFEAKIREPAAPASSRAREPLTPLRILNETFEMIGKVLGDPGLRKLLLYIAAFHLFLSALPVSLPFYVENVLRISGKWFGFFIAAYTAGILAGFVLSGILPPATQRFRRIALMSAQVGLLFGVTAATGNAWVAWAALFGIGAGIGVIIVNLMTELQLKGDERDRGGIMGAAHAVGGASFPLGMALTGLLLDGLHRLDWPYGTSIRLILAASAVSSTILAVSALRRTPRRTLDGETSA